MIRIAGLLLIALTLAAPAHARHRARKPHHKPKHGKHVVRKTPVTMQLISFPKIPQRFLEAQVNDSSKQLFMVDTAAADTAIFDWYADELRIQSDGASAIPQGPDFHKVKLASLRIGPVEKTGVAAVVVKDNGVFKKLKVAGIISPSNFLKGKTFTLDFKQNLIILDSKLKKPLHLEIALRDCGGQKKFSIPAEINGHAAQLELSSGDSRMVLTPSFATQAQLARTGPSKTPSIPVPKLGIPHNMVQEDLKLANHTFQNEGFVVEQHPSLCESDGSLGMGFLEGLRLTFSKDRKKLTVEK